MTSFYVPAVTSQASLSSIALQATSVASDNDSIGRQNDLLMSSVRVFWSSFPCPPPWNGDLLKAVNTSRLGQRVTGFVTEFLASKCEVLAGYQETREGDNAESHLPENADEITWCDRTCQLAIGCSGVLMAMIIATVALVCFTRVRRPHKMAATRPSRQQLQLSTSTSDAVNWAEFSNTQLQFDDDGMIYPPFRHRGLPNPPSQCHHPSCDPKWNCPTCSSCHPLMRMSPSGGTTRSHGPYTAVYETIDDEDDDASSTVTGTLTGNRLPKYQGGGTLPNRPEGGLMDQLPPCSSLCHTFSPRKTSTPPNDLNRRDEQRGEAETVFNGDDLMSRWPPHYFELDHSYDQALMNLNQLHPSNRNATGMKSFQSPHHDNQRGFHPIMSPGTYGNNPPPVTQMSCNQLCATCVPNIVSMAPCVNMPRQNGYIPNGNMLNVNPYPNLNPNTYPQRLMCVSTTENNSHVYDPSLFRDRNNIFESNASQSESESTSVHDDSNVDSRYFQSPGCDLTSQRVTSDSSQPLFGHQRAQPPQVAKRQCTDDALSESNKWQALTPCNANGDLNSHDPQQTTLPFHHWCPTCREVPLLGNDMETHRHSAYEYENNGDSDPHAVNGGCWQGTCHSHEADGCYLDSSLATYENGESCADSDIKNVGNNSTAEQLHNSNDSGLPSENPSNAAQRPWLPDVSSSTSKEMMEDMENDNVSGLTNDNDPCSARVIALHSRYFKKTSKA